ncbi:MAG: FkbM family methyltransferase [Phycisphaerales bacterium]|nr:FkbM family methyltransferase [Phycisphaerales bacterium]
MILDLGDWSQRGCYYHGRFYDLANQRLIRRLLSEGDTYIDVGANIGMMTLAAARVVGSTGRVLSFEPNPQARQHLDAHVRINGLTQVRVVDKGLSCERGQLTLRLPVNSSGRGTMRNLSGDTAGEFQVDVALLDDYLAQIPTDCRVLLKVDTEGFDFNVLRGARGLLLRNNVFAVAEVNDAWLKEMGQSAEAMFNYMEELGYDAYFADMCPRGLSQKLDIRPVSMPGPHHWFDALFARHEDREIVCG